MRMVVLRRLLAGAASVMLGIGYGAAVSAFPGAEGFGSETEAGRGGAVYYVTSLADTGPGTLRSVLNTPGRRTILFKVGGTIRLNSPLMLTEPWVTIAGQTAPGSGITIKRESRTSGQTNNTVLRVFTHDVVVRHLRLRGGTDRSNYPDQFDTGLAIGNGAWNVVIDHVSVSWNTDENIALGGVPQPAHDISIQWSISSEVLNIGCGGGSCPGKGGLLADPPGVERVSIHHNLFASNWDRNPTIGGSGVWDIVNNVMANISGIYASALSDWDCDGPTPTLIRANYVSNYIQAGPSSPPGHYPLVLFPISGGPGIAVYRAGNGGVPWFAYCNRYDVTFPGCHVNSTTPCTFADYEVSARHVAPPITETTPATLALRNDVLDHAGATLPMRDAVDNCVTNSIYNNTGAVLTALGQGCAFFPPDDPGLAPLDTDSDGMPDAWELSYGLDPFAATDGRLDKDRDIYTNLEEYINSTNPFDADQDLVTDSLDNCLDLANPAQENQDGDRAGDACDCRPADPLVFAVPSEVTSLRVLANQVTVAWDSAAPSAGNGTTHDLLRGLVTQLPVGGSGESCVASNVAGATADDPARPAVGDAVWYLARGATVCGEGPWGQTSAGSARTSSVCP